MWPRSAISFAALSALWPATGAGHPAPFAPVYVGVETRPDGDLVNFFVDMRGARALRTWRITRMCCGAVCVDPSMDFARHLRTNVAQEGGSGAEMLFTPSLAALPRGLKTIDAEVVALACAENGIPMV